VGALAAREFGSMVRTPVGWVVAALFCFLTGAVFVATTLDPGGPATMRAFFSTASWLMVAIAPAVSMKSFSEELRSGTAEVLRTAPVGDGALVLGKFGGGAVFLLAMLLPTLVLPGVLVLISSPMPDAGAIAAGYLGLLLLGWLCLSVGLLCSTLTSSQTLAFLAALIVLITLALVSGPLVSRLPAWAAPAARGAAILPRVADFSRGVLDTRHLAFFAGGVLVMLAGAFVSLDARRWWR
jgi:ABC-2 type transport system permease protein